MARKLPHRDVVVIGVGWAGAIIANELAEEGLSVVGLERGPYRDTAKDFNISSAPDELRYVARHDLMVRPAQTTTTARNSASETALPMRDHGTFAPGNGVGGAGLHWSGLNWRFEPSTFRWRSHLTERYGAKAIGDLTLQDWGVDWKEMEPFYDQFERIAGISGKAGNIQGKIQAGGNPFEGPRQRDYPLPPTMEIYGPKLFGEAAASLGYHPFPTPTGNLSGAYTNSLGVAMAPCTYCGFCNFYGCANFSKSSAITTVLPVLMRKPTFELRTDSEVLRITLDRSGTRATGVVYIDSSGEEIEQPADIVVLSAFLLENVRLMLLSGIGKPYNPVDNTGVVGRNFAYQMANNVQAFFDDKHFNPYMTGGSTGVAIDDFNNDNFDHTGLGFVGGGNLRQIPITATPIGFRPTPAGTPRWGSKWKDAVVKNYNSTLVIAAEGSSVSTRANYLDLDPTYTDRLGRKLLRVTFDFPENDRKMSRYITEKAAGIAKAMGARETISTVRDQHWSTVPYQTTHITGGAVMGTDPRTSAVNTSMQSWDVPNVFVVGSSAYPQNPGHNPTGTVGALAVKAAHDIRTKYLKAPGKLVTA